MTRSLTKRSSRAAVLALSASLLVPAMASADAVQQDVDFTAPGKDDQTVHLGPVEPGADIERTAKFRLVCNRFFNGKLYRKHVDEGQVLTIEWRNGSLKSVVAEDVEFPPIPASWPDDGKGCTKDPPRHFPKDSSSITFKAPSAPGKHEVHVRYDDVLKPAQGDDGGDIVGTPPMAVHFVLNVVSDRHHTVAKFNTNFAKGLVYVQEVDGDTARLRTGWKKAPRGKYKIIGSSQACPIDLGNANRVFSDVGKTKAGRWNFTVPTSQDVGAIKSIRVRRGAKEECASTAPYQAAGIPFPPAKLRSISQVGKSNAKGLAKVTELAGNKAQVQFAWRKRPLGTHSFIGSSQPCSVKHFGKAKLFFKPSLTKAGKWQFVVPLSKDQSKLQSIRVKSGGKQRACLSTTQLKKS